MQCGCDLPSDPGRRRRFTNQPSQLQFPTLVYVKMKQSTLSFAAAKRTASNINVAKRKVSSSASSAAEKAKAAKSSKRVPSKKRDLSDEESDDDDVVSKDSNEEGVVQTEQTKLSIPEDSGTHGPQQTRSDLEKSVPSTTTKKKSAKVQDLETRRSLPFKESNLTPEVLQDKINANDIDQLPELDPSNKKWNKQYAAARAKQGGQTASECPHVPV